MIIFHVRPNVRYMNLVKLILLESIFKTIANINFVKLFHMLADTVGPILNFIL